MAIIIPSIANTIKRLTMMMDVMDCRGYIVGDERTSIYRLHWTKNDTLIVGFITLTLVGIIIL